MKIRNLILLKLVILMASCSTDHSKEILTTSKTPRLDLAYYVVVLDNMNEFGNSIAIVDRTIDSTSTPISGINSVVEKKDSYYWNKSIFPELKYINGDSLLFFSSNNTDKYWKLRGSYKSGWIQLSNPLFTKNDEKVIIEVSYFKGESFGSSVFYVLEWKGNKYEIIEKGLISIS